VIIEKHKAKSASLCEYDKDQGRDCGTAHRQSERVHRRFNPYARLVHRRLAVPGVLPTGFPLALTLAQRSLGLDPVTLAMLNRRFD
jgi:hypothetical protein